MAKYVFPIFFILLISFFQFLFNNFFYPLSALNLPLVIIVYLIFNYDFRSSLLLGLGSAMIMELYSPYAFGSILISFFLAIFLVNFLFLNFLTGKSFLSLVILGFASILIYNFFLEFFNFLNFTGRIGHPFSSQFFYNFFWQCALNLIILIVVYLISNLLREKVRSIFIIKHEAAK